MTDHATLTALTGHGVPVCKHCGKPKDEHQTIRYAGAELLNTPYLCPTSVWAEDSDATRERRPTP